MPVDGYPLPTDRTDDTVMDDNHPLDHNQVNRAVNELSEFMDAVLEEGVGSVSEAEMTLAIETAVGNITAEDVGALPDTAETLAIESGVLAVPATLAAHPAAPPADSAVFYVLTDETVWVQNSAGSKTQLAPPFVSPSTLLATEAAVSSTTAADVLSVAVAANAMYDVCIDFVYEAHNVSGEGLRFEFTVPTGADGHWRGEYVNSGNTGVSGSATPNHLAKKWSENHSAGGLSIGVPAAGRITGTLITDSTAGNFVWRARLAGGATPGKIYGMNTADYAGARMTLTRIA